MTPLCLTDTGKWNTYTPYHQRSRSKPCNLLFRVFLASQRTVKRDTSVNHLSDFFVRVRVRHKCGSNFRRTRRKQSHRNDQQKHRAHRYGVKKLSKLDAGKPIGYRLPMYYVPPGVQVVGAAILVVEVVRVLPDVAAQQRDCAVRERVILIGG